ncbi:hypothetical protein IMSAG049_00707 [Clostridiales bacterium]|nr:hypothetical protein IMSAG049_00707 [Clostridiales bacterium]
MGTAELLAETVKKLTKRDGEYASKEQAMREHAKDGNISLYLDLLDELQYPDTEEDEEENAFGFSL